MIGAYYRARGVHGLGEAICLDQNQNTIPCSSPDCTYGDCGAAGPQLSTGPLCLDQSQNQVPCSNPECTYGDCTAPAKSNTVTTAINAAGYFLPAVTGGVTGRGPSPTVQVPLSTSSAGLFLESSNLIPGLPNWGVLFGGLAVLLLVATAGGRRR